MSATGNSRGLLLQVKNQRTRPGPMGPMTELLVQNDYTYDNSGQRLTNTITDAGGARTESYGYDELSRLTSWCDSLVR